ncbi:MAG: hypothetical protein R3A45_06500 [Bdellovibrionota bacterium]
MSKINFFYSQKFYLVGVLLFLWQFFTPIASANYYYEVRFKDQSNKPFRMLIMGTNHIVDIENLINFPDFFENHINDPGNPLSHVLSELPLSGIEQRWYSRQENYHEMAINLFKEPVLYLLEKRTGKPYHKLTRQDFIQHASLIVNIMLNIESLIKDTTNTFFYQVIINNHVLDQISFTKDATFHKLFDHGKAFTLSDRISKHYKNPDRAKKAFDTLCANVQEQKLCDPNNQNAQIVFGLMNEGYILSEFFRVALQHHTQNGQLETQIAQQYLSAIQNSLTFDYLDQQIARFPERTHQILQLADNLSIMGIEKYLAAMNRQTEANTRDYEKGTKILENSCASFDPTILGTPDYRNIQWYHNLVGFMQNNAAKCSSAFVMVGHCHLINTAGQGLINLLQANPNFVVKKINP